MDWTWEDKLINPQITMCILYNSAFGKRHTIGRKKGQLSADFKMKKYNIKTSFDSTDGVKARTKLFFMIFILILVENCL